MIYLLGIIFSALLLGGCELHHPQTLSKHDVREHLRPYVNTPNYLSGNPQLPGNVTYRSLNRAGVFVKEHGDEIKLILPTDLFFTENSYELKPDKLGTLNLIAVMINAVDEPAIIIGNTDPIGSKKHKYLTSKKLATSIKNYLWKNGVEQNRIITRGAADSRPVSANTVKGKSLNRRIEIQIRHS
ncbi:MAG: OmpA family protein [Legionellales bacterium]|nr:OmpA family protein [Legionellales bacterium]